MWPFGFGNRYPYTDFHELNLDWILDKIRELEHHVSTFSKDIKGYVDSWLEDHPEATTTVQDGSITIEKFAASVVDDTLTESGHPADAAAVGEYVRSNHSTIADAAISGMEIELRDGELLGAYTGYTTLQGGCFDSTRNNYILAFTDGSDNVILVRLDNSLNYISRTSPIELFHANDLAYSPANDEIYVATGDQKIIVLAASNLTIIRVENVSHSVDMLCYDPDNDILYAGDYTTIYSYQYENNILVLKGSAPDDLVTYIDNEYSLVRQGMFFWNGVCKLSGIIDSHAGFYACNMIQMGDDGNYYNKEIPISNRVLEPECVCMKNDNTGMIFLKGSRYFAHCAISLDAGKTVIERETEPADKYIESGTDLNNLLSPSDYVCQTAVIAASLSNTPITDRLFNMRVYSSAYGDITQLITDRYANTYVRHYEPTSDAWSSWASNDFSTLKNATINATYFPTGYCQYVKFGNVCVFCALLENTTSQNDVPNNTEIVSGLPGSKVNNIKILGQNNNAASPSMLIKIGSDGIMRSAELIARNCSVRIAGSYIVI